MNPQMNPQLAHAQQFDPSVAPKRSNSGREILYIQNQRIVGSNQHLSNQHLNDFVPQQQHNPSMLGQHMPPEVRAALDMMRHLSYREIYHWLKIDRQHGRDLRSFSLVYPLTLL